MTECKRLIGMLVQGVLFYFLASVFEDDVKNVMYLVPSMLSSTVFADKEDVGFS